MAAPAVRDPVEVAIPFFVALVVLEAVISGWRRSRGREAGRGYEARDTAASLAMGLGSVAIGLVGKGVEFALYSAAALALGRTDRQLFTQALADAHSAHDRKVLESGKPEEYEEELAHRDGGHSYFTVKFPLLRADGTAYAVCCVSSDITERKRAEWQLHSVREEERLRISRDIHDQLGQTLTVPVKNGEGCWFGDPELVDQLETNGQIVFRYAPGENPNGAIADVAGVCNEAGNVVGLMPHPEHAVDPVLGSTDEISSAFAWSCGVSVLDPVTTVTLCAPCSARTDTSISPVSC